MPRKSKKSHGSFNHAPTQGVGEVMTRQFNDIQAVLLPQDAVAGLYVVRVSADVNGFTWSIQNQENYVASYPNDFSSDRQEYYGGQNALFQYWANLFAQYRVNTINVQFEPIGSGSTFSSTPVFSVCDDSDSLNGIQPLGNLLSKVSSYPSVQICSPYKVTSRSFDYRGNWLGQAQERSWLQTQQPGSQALIRELYATRLTVDASVPSDAPTKTIPGLCMINGVNSVSTSGGVIGVLRIRSSISFRQRNVMPTVPFVKEPAPSQKPTGPCCEAEAAPQDKISEAHVASILEPLSSGNLSAPALDLTRSQMIGHLQQMTSALGQGIVTPK